MRSESPPSDLLRSSGLTVEWGLMAPVYGPPLPRRERISMSDEMQDFKLNTADKDADPKVESKRPIWIYLIIAIVVVAALIYFLRPEKTPDTQAEPAPAPVEDSAPAPQVAEESSLEIGEPPEIGNSDNWLREIVRQLSTHPELAQWLLTDELIRTFVVVVDNVAEGTPPSSNIKFLAPAEGFKVQETDGQVTIDPASYRRYNTMIDVIESIDAAGAAELYKASHPLLQEAYEDLGYPGQSFDVALGRAVQRLLAVPVIDGPIELEADIAAYKYQDESLEQLSPVAKQFLRLGPENLRRLQAKVRELARAAGVSTG